jgi:hypothetical protein
MDAHYQPLGFASFRAGGRKSSSVDSYDENVLEVDARLRGACRLSANAYRVAFALAGDTGDRAEARTTSDQDRLRPARFPTTSEKT